MHFGTSVHTSVTIPAGETDTSSVAVEQKVEHVEVVPTEPEVEYRELSFNEKLGALMKQRDEELIGLVPPIEEVSKQFNQFMKNRNSLVKNVYVEEMKKKGFMVPVTKVETTTETKTEKVPETVVTPVVVSEDKLKQD